MPKAVYNLQRPVRNGASRTPEEKTPRDRRLQVPPDDDGQVYSIVESIKRFRHPMSVAQLAPLLGVSDDVLYRMVREGKIPQLVMPGRKITLFDPASIVFWLCKHNPLLKQVQKAS